MRNLLALVGLALVLFGGLGWYLGWYKIKTSPGEPGHRDVHIDINTQKLGSDVHNGEQHLQQWLDNGKDGKSEPAKEPPGKSGAVRALPEPSGFPIDPPAPGADANSVAPLPVPSTFDAPVPTTFFNKQDTSGSEPFPAPSGSLP